MNRILAACGFVLIVTWAAYASGVPGIPVTPSSDALQRSIGRDLRVSTSAYFRHCLSRPRLTDLLRESLTVRKGRDPVVSAISDLAIARRPGFRLSGENVLSQQTTLQEFQAINKDQQLQNLLDWEYAIDPKQPKYDDRAKELGVYLGLRPITRAAYDTLIEANKRKILGREIARMAPDGFVSTAAGFGGNIIAGATDPLEILLFGLLVAAYWRLWMGSSEAGC